jgi:hypothetical protein
MKGIVFNLLEQVVTEEFGENAWDDVLDGAGSQGAYTAVGSYPDADFMGLVATASRQLDQPVDDLVRWFGTKAVPHFAQLYPQFFAPFADTRSFVLTLNDVIHPEVRKLFPGADVPNFDFSTPDEHSVSIGYQSARKLCSFAEGLVEGAAAHYGETVAIVQTKCMKQGDPRCVLVCEFSRVNQPAGA